MTTLRIDVIGGGSIGLLYAARLAISGASVTVWTRTHEQSDIINREGIRFMKDNGSAEEVIAVSSEWLTSERISSLQQLSSNWIILAVKQTDITEQLLQLIHMMSFRLEEGSAIVCLQNGIGHIEKLTTLDLKIPVYAAVTTEGAKREDKRTVRHTGIGQVWISEEAENDRNREQIDVISQKMFIDYLKKAGFDVFLSNEINKRVFQKLLINAVINPLTSIFDSTNGELPKHIKRLDIMKALFDETVIVLQATGMDVPEDSWERLLDVCQKTSSNISSMLGDVRAGRHTEIDAINGAIVRLAEQHQLKAPMNESVIAMIKSYKLDHNNKE
ncbi:2-dehydropantoate 2-reductase [Paenibacillus sp. GSMTC-2017]|uniref:2-dehydropantoate 2-reductase n=1 Tax=Paenibacillus sp. GSMTC-2017 TaxID=2794350 RepID=UPI0018D61C48|nr:2-dehydropantoate 2-reductase [Paenibacillus sp. GSMTC-2017]